MTMPDPETTTQANVRMTADAKTGRRLNWAVILAILSYAVLGVWYASDFSSRVSTLEDQVAALRKQSTQNEQLSAEIRRQLASMTQQLAAMNANIDRLIRLDDERRRDTRRGP